MKAIKAIKAIPFVVLLLAMLARSSFGQSYQLVDLAALLGTNSYAQGINNDGQVVGYWETTNGAHAFLYQNGAMTDLGLLGRLGTNNFALSINNSGQVVGFSETTNGAVAFIYQNGGVTNLGNFGGLGSYAFGINDGGQIVGHVATDNGAAAFLYNNGVVTSLGSLGGSNSFAYGVNNALQVAGSSLKADNVTTHAFLWQNGVIRDLNQLLPYNSGWELMEAHGINDYGSIAGWGIIGAQAHAFLYYNGGWAVDLGTLPGSTNSYALGLNRSNVVVGVSLLPSGARAVIWAGGTMTDLNGLINASGWELKEATGINDSGQIVGWGVTNEQERAFLIQPVPPLVAPAVQSAGGKETKISPATAMTADLVKSLASSTISISITNPISSIIYSVPTNLAINASATDSGGTVTQVQFYIGTRLLAASTNAPYSTIWSNAVMGIHALTAVARDNVGTVATSSVVNVSIATNLLATADAYVRDGSYTNINYGTNTVLQCLTTSTNGNNRDVYFKFNLTGLSNISSAKLNVFAQLSGPGSVSNTVYSVTNTSWGETNITWSNKPVRVTALMTNSVAGTNWNLFDVSSYVTLQTTNGLNVISLALHEPTNFNLLMSINSRENPTNPPSLLIVTTNSPLNVAITNLANGAVFAVPTNLVINASVSDSDGTVTQVLFFQGTNKLGSVASAPYSLTWSNASAGAYALTAVASDSSGLSMTSGIVNVVFDIPPSLSAQPTNQVVKQGSNVVFSVTAAGTTPLSYRWLFNGTNVAGATNVSLTITNVQATNAGSYSVVVTNLVGSVTSTNAVLTLLTAPSILLQPTNMVVLQGVNATFSVTASGTTPLNYQWYSNGTNLAGATNSAYTISNAQTNNTGSYSVTITNVVGSVTSTNAVLTVQAPPFILTQPTNAAVKQGSNAVFAITAGWTAPLSYRWLFNGTNVAGATNVSLTITNVQATNAGSYSVVVTNLVGSATSTNAVLALLAAPTIAVAPTNVIVLQGSNATFSVMVNGTQPLNYQWYFGGTNLPGATNNVYALNNVQTNNAGSYSVTITNQFGSVTTNAVLTVRVPPFIMSQPTNAAVIKGSNAVFSVTAGGTTPLSYRWLFNGTNVAGATNVTLTITNAQATNAGNYSVIVTNVLGSVSSTNAVLALVTAPSISLQPTNLVVLQGSNATFSVTASGTAPLNYQWYFNGTNVAGASNSVYTVSNARTNNAGSYSVTITNVAGGVTSTNAVLTVRVPPFIVTQPTNQAVRLGSNATFAVTPGGTAPWSYRWRFNGTNMTGAATNFLLTITNVTSAKLGNYSVVVTNAVGSVTSSVASLMILTPPSVSITSPVSNSMFTLGTTVVLYATASDANGSIAQVRFYQRTNLLGTLTNSPYTLIWTNLLQGTYLFTAVAVDSFGLVSTSSVVNISTTPLPASIGVGDVDLWYRADSLTGLTNGATIYTWPDSLGRGRDASSFNGSWWGPIYVTNAANGNPVGRFMTNNVMWAPGFNGTNNSAELFAVLKVGDPRPSYWSSPWNLGGGIGISTTASQYPAADGSIWDDFASTTMNSAGIPSTPLTQYHVFEESGTNGFWGARINGEAIATSTNNTFGYADMYHRSIGTGYFNAVSGSFFNGDIAEIITFNRLLSDSERQAVEIYLVHKYGIIVPTSVTITNPANYAVLTNGSDISLEANASDEFGTIANVQFFQGGTCLGVVTNPPYILTWTNLPAGNHTFTAQVTDAAGLMATSSVVNVFVCGPTLLSDMTAWWRAEGNTLDSVGTNDGVLSGGVTYASGEVGQAFNFDGSSGYVATSVPVNDPQNFSLDLWFKTSSQGGPGGALMGFCNSPSDTANITDRVLYLDDSGLLHFGIYNLNFGFQMVDSTVGYNDGVWHHAAATISMATGSALYVDGSLVASNSSATTGQNFTGWWLIGQNNLRTWPSSPASYYFNGQIDEVSIYNHPLSAADIASIYNAGSHGKAPNLSVSLTNPVNNTWLLRGSNINLAANVSDAGGGAVTELLFGAGTDVFGMFTNPPYAMVWTNPPVGTYSLVAVASDSAGLTTTSAPVNVAVKEYLADMLAWWRAEGNAMDSLGNNDGYLQGNAGFTNGEVGQAFNFNGANGCGLYVPAFYGLPSGNAPHSIEGWVNVPALPSSQASILWLGSPNSGSESWLLNADGSLQMGVVGGSQADFSLPVGSWVHLALTFDGQTLCCYTNGTLQSAQAATFNFPAAFAFTMALPGFNGFLDEFSVYARALNAAEIAAIYQAGSGGKAVGLTVTLTNPPANVAIPAGSSISLGASVWDPSGTVSLVQFVQGTTSLGVVTNPPYTLVWTNPATGAYEVSAQATDIGGLVITSSVVSVVVDTPPAVGLTNPTNNAVIVPGPMMLAAAASDVGGTIAAVQFFQGTNCLGTATASPYNYLWLNPPPGACSLTAVATDNNGFSSTSSVANVLVDVPPTVALTYPVNNSIFVSALTNLTLTAAANDSDGTVAQVQFYQGTNSLGTMYDSPYSLTWASVPVGNYALTAVATDNDGLASTSAVVNVVVTPLSVVITNPVNSSIFISNSTNLSLAATTVDLTGNIAQVQFFQGITSLGVVVNPPYTLVWSNAPFGNYALTAVAMDRNGLMATSSVVDVYITPLFASSNLNLWLSANTLVGISNGASIGIWSDQSGNGENALQTSANNQSQWVAGALNGLPAVQFNGSSYFNLPNFLNGTVGAEAFVVLRAATNTPAVPSELWTFGGGLMYHSAYPAPDGSVAEDFGSTAMMRLGVPAQPLNQYNVYEVMGQNGSWAAWLNGMLLASTTNNVYGYNSVPMLGRRFTGGNGVDQYFNGAVAELLVFNRPLTGSERTTVNNYLKGKYGLVPPVPAAPTNVVATAISSTQIGLSWNEVLTGGGTTQTSIERATASNGVFAVVAQVGNTLSYVDTNLAANATYYYRVRAINLEQWSAYSSVAQASTFGSGADVPFGNLALWLKADAGLVQGGSNLPVSQWSDQSGNGENALQTSANNQPQWEAGALNGLPAVQFNGSSYFNLPNFLNGTVGAEAFVVLRAATNTPPVPSELWSFGGGMMYHSAYPAPDGSLAEDFGSTTMMSLGVPAEPVNQYNVYQVMGQNGSWAMWMNGILQDSTTNNVYGYNSVPMLGRRFTGGNGVDQYFNGAVAELLVFNRPLADSERTNVNRYLINKYGLTPTPPANLVATTVSLTQIGLLWAEPLDNQSTQISIERALTSNGVYQVVAELPVCTAYVDTNLAPGTTYYYRVRAINTVQYHNQPYSPYSAIAQATTWTNGTPLPIGSMALWLRADAGIVTNASGQVSCWVDQSGGVNNATQSASGAQPLWVPGALGGQPVVHFNGSQSCLNLPNFMNGATGGVAFVVLRATPDYPVATHPLWSFGADLADCSTYPGSDWSVADDFGSSSTHGEGVPSQPLTAYHVYEVSSFTNDWEARFNRVLAARDTQNTPSFAVAVLGEAQFTEYIAFEESYSLFFEGDIAEVMVFSNQLSTADRETVSSYLNGKYSLVPAVPAPPTNLVATAISPTQVSLSWDEHLNGGVTRVSIERLDANWNYQVIAEVSDATSYMDTNATPGTTYYYRVRAINIAQWSDYSKVAQTQTPVQGGSVPFGSLKLWLKADSGLLRDAPNTSINLWADQSGNGNHATQPVKAAQPVWVPGALGDHPAVQFNGGSAFKVPNFLNGLGSAEAFVVLKVAGTSGALWEFGDAPNPNAYPAADGSISDDFGSTTVQSLGIPPQPLNQFHVYEVSSQRNNWQAWINGCLLYQTSETSFNSVSFAAGLTLGASQGGYFSGDIAEVLVFDRPLATSERAAVNQYLDSKYSLAPVVAITSPADDAVLMGPTNLSITATANDSAGISQVEFFQGTTSLGLVTNTPYSLVWSNVPLGSYSLTARAVDNNGLVFTSSVVNATVDGVVISSPSNHAVLLAPANIPVAASVVAGAGVSQVQFFQGATCLGTFTNAPCGFVWSNVPAGVYGLTAVVVDEYGLTMTSSVVNVTVDTLPGVLLTSPTNNARLVAGGNVALTATASSASATITQVQFFQGTNLLGSVANAPYNFVWTNVPFGNFALTAQATDNFGLVSTSAVVDVLVAGIAITNPPNNFVTAASAGLTIGAAVVDNAAISQVQFFQGTNSLGMLTSPPYAFNWTGVVPGIYTLTATATDVTGFVLTSVPVTVIVDANPNTTNRSGDGQSDYLDYLEGRNPLVGTVPDTNNVLQFQTYTPLQ